MPARHRRQRRGRPRPRMARRATVAPRDAVVSRPLAVACRGSFHSSLLPCYPATLGRSLSGLLSLLFRQHRRHGGYIRREQTRGRSALRATARGADTTRGAEPCAAAVAAALLLLHCAAACATSGSTAMLPCCPAAVLPCLPAALLLHGAAACATPGPASAAPLHPRGGDGCSRGKRPVR